MHYKQRGIVLSMLAGHLEIKKNSEDDYVINNTITNRYVKLGTRELNYLLYLKDMDQVDSDEQIEVALDENQKKILHKKFDELQLLTEAKMQKKKKDFSNMVLVSFESAKWFKLLMDKFKVVISPLGFALFVASIGCFFYAIYFQSEAILSGISNLTINALDLIFLYILNVFTVILHEFCHATACYKYSGKTGRIGIKLFYMFPAYFCDVSSMYMVSSRKKPLIVSAVGLAANSVIGNLSLFIYVILYNQQIEQPIFLYFFCYNLFVILFNLNPFAKFDGYWIVKSISGVDNLYDKSIILFFTLILNIRQCIVIQISLWKKCLLTVYGMLIFLFHWLFWGYSIYVISSFKLDALNIQIRIVLTAALIIIGLMNCIKFTFKYHSLYKKNAYVY